MIWGATFTEVDAMIATGQADVEALRLQDYMLRPSLNSVRLTQVFEPFAANDGPVSVVYQPSPHFSSKAQTLSIS